MLYKWDSKYELGVQEIDDQHRCIFDLANALHAAGATPGTPEVVAAVLFEMEAYVDTHFDDEEAHMRSIGFPHYEEHCRIHKEMRAKVRDLAERFERMEVRASELHVLVVGWLMNHITKADMQIASFLQNKEEAA